MTEILPKSNSKMTDSFQFYVIIFMIIM